MMRCDEIFKKKRVWRTGFDRVDQALWAPDYPATDRGRAARAYCLLGTESPVPETCGPVGEYTGHPGRLSAHQAAQGRDVGPRDPRPGRPPGPDWLRQQAGVPETRGLPLCQEILLPSPACDGRGAERHRGYFGQLQLGGFYFRYAQQPPCAPWGRSS